MNRAKGTSQLRVDLDPTPANVGKQTGLQQTNEALNEYGTAEARYRSLETFRQSFRQSKRLLRTHNTVTHST